MRKILVYFIASILLQTQCFAATSGVTEFALPSDVKDIKKTSGSVFYSPTAKGRVLIPIHFWGEVSRSGLHYIPVDTGLIKGLSLAGGPKSSAKLDSIKITRKASNSVKELSFDLSQGGSADAYNFKLRSGDTVFVEKNYFYENRAYYTSLIGVITTLVSSLVIFSQVKK